MVAPLLPELTPRWNRLTPTVADMHRINDIVALVGIGVFLLIVASVFTLQPQPGESRPYLIGLALVAFGAVVIWITVRDMRRGFYVCTKGFKFVDPLWTLHIPWESCEFSIEEQAHRRRLAVHDKSRDRTWYGGDLYVERIDARSGELDALLRYLRECAAGARGAEQ